MNKENRPSGYLHLTDIQVMKLLTLNEKGETQQAIALELGCSQSTVQRVLSKHNYETFTGRTPTPGPARKTTKHDDRHLIQVAKDNHRLPFRDITNLSGLPISAKTVMRRCKEVQLISRYPRRKPFLTPKHRTDRLEWAIK
jgi:AraC-like DNA-binding protein